VPTGVPHRGALVLAAVLVSGCAGDCEWPGPGWIAYVALDARGNDVRAVRADGACDRSVSAQDRAELEPSVSLAQNTITYVTFRTGAPRIATRELYSTVERLVDVGEIAPASPVLSPDGKWIAFTGIVAPALSELYVVAAGGGTPTVVASSPALEAAPAWTNDSSTLFFASRRTGRYQLFRVNVDGSGLEQVTTDATSALTCGASACAILSRPSPSPDGSALALVRAAPDGFYRVVLKDLQSGQERLLSDDPDSEPSWDPSGGRIAVTTGIYGAPRVAIRDVGTGEVLEVPTGPNTGAPSFAR